MSAVNIPSQGSNVLAGTECVATGWGAIQVGYRFLNQLMTEMYRLCVELQEGGAAADVLRKVTLPIVSDSECRQSYGVANILNGMICAGYKQGILIHLIERNVSMEVIAVPLQVDLTPVKVTVEDLWSSKERKLWSELFRGVTVVPDLLFMVNQSNSFGYKSLFQ